MVKEVVLIFCIHLIQVVTIIVQVQFLRLSVSISLQTNLITFNNVMTINNLLECGPMPNVMAALPNIGSALC